MMQQEEPEAVQKIFPFAPLATSYEKGWKGLQAVRYRKSHISELNAAGTPRTHVLILTVRPPVPPLEGLNLPELRSVMLAVDAIAIAHMLRCDECGNLDNNGSIPRVALLGILMVNIEKFEAPET